MTRPLQLSLAREARRVGAAGRFSGSRSRRLRLQ